MIFVFIHSNQIVMRNIFHWSLFRARKVDGISYVKLIFGHCKSDTYKFYIQSTECGISFKHWCWSIKSISEGMEMKDENEFRIFSALQFDIISIDRCIWLAFDWHRTYFNLFLNFRKIFLWKIALRIRDWKQKKAIGKCYYDLVWFLGTFILSFLQCSHSYYWLFIVIKTIPSLFHFQCYILLVHANS